MKRFLITAALLLVASPSLANGVYRDEVKVTQTDRYVCRQVPGGYAGWIEVEGTIRHIVRPPSESCGWRPVTRTRSAGRTHTYRHQY